MAAGLLLQLEFADGYSLARDPELFHQGVAVQILASKKAMPDITMSELANVTGLPVADEKKDANLVRRVGHGQGRALGSHWVNANHRIYITAVVRL